MAERITYLLASELPVCPYCDHIEGNAWELDFGPGLEGETEANCASCGERYHIRRMVNVSYSTGKKSKEA